MWKKAINLKVKLFVKKYYLLIDNKVILKRIWNRLHKKELNNLAKDIKISNQINFTKI